MLIELRPWFLQQIGANSPQTALATNLLGKCTSDHRFTSILQRICSFSRFSIVFDIVANCWLFHIEFSFVSHSFPLPFQERHSPRKPPMPKKAAYARKKQVAQKPAASSVRQNHIFVWSIPPSELASVSRRRLLAWHPSRTMLHSSARWIFAATSSRLPRSIHFQHRVACRDQYIFSIVS